MQRWSVVSKKDSSHFVVFVVKVAGDHRGRDSSGSECDTVEPSSSGRHFLSSEMMRAISNVRKFFEEERHLKRRLSVRCVVKRTAAALGVSGSSVTRVRSMEKSRSAQVHQPTSYKQSSIEESWESWIREAYLFLVQQRVWPTLDKILTRLTTDRSADSEAPAWPYGRTTLFKYMRQKLKFKWVRHGTSEFKVIERPDVVLQRERCVCEAGSCWLFSG